MTKKEVLALVASDVALALGMVPDAHPANWYYRKGSPELMRHLIKADGSNLTDPYWFWRCCEWLTSTGWDIQIGADGFHESWRMDGSPDEHVALNGPIPTAEAPARLVSVVWRRNKP